MNRIAGIIGLIIGLVLGSFFINYFGFWTVLIPAVGIALIWFIGYKSFKDSRRLFLPSIAIEGGHFLWMLTGSVIIFVLNPSQLQELLEINLFGLLLDIIIFGGLIIWLWLSSDKKSAIANLVFQIISLGANVYTLTELNLDDPFSRAVLLHILLRILAIISLIIGINKIKNYKQRNVAEQSQQLIDP